MSDYLSLPKSARITVDRDGIHVTDDGDGGNTDPRAAFKQRLADAWRGSDRATTQTLDHLKRKREISQAWRGGDADDAGGPYGATPSAPERAYAKRSDRLASAWRAPPLREQPWVVMQKRKYKPGLPKYDGAADSADFHFDDDDAQQRRDDANAAYVDRIRSAWKG